MSDKTTALEQALIDIGLHPSRSGIYEGIGTRMQLRTCLCGRRGGTAIASLTGRGKTPRLHVTKVCGDPGCWWVQNSAVTSRFNMTLDMVKEYRLQSGAMNAPQPKLKRGPLPGHKYGPSTSGLLVLDNPDEENINSRLKLGKPLPGVNYIELSGAESVARVYSLISHGCVLKRNRKESYYMACAYILNVFQDCLQARFVYEPKAYVNTEVSAYAIKHCMARLMELNLLRCVWRSSNRSCFVVYETSTAFQMMFPSSSAKLFCEDWKKKSDDYYLTWCVGIHERKAS